MRMVLRGAMLAATLTVASVEAQRGPAPTPFKEVWHFDAEPTGFKSPRSIIVFASCQVWVADDVAGVFRMGCDGGTPQQVGTRGRNKGEYQQPWALAAIGTDSVALFDRDLQRIQFYDANGVAGSFRDLRLPEQTEGQVTAFNFGAGRFRFWTTHFPNVIDPAALNSYVIALHPTGNGRDTIATLDGVPSIYWGSSFGNSKLATPNQRRPILAFLPSGGFVMGMNDVPTINVQEAALVSTRQIAMALTPQPVTKGDRDAYADSVRKVTEQEMLTLHYNQPDKVKYRAQIETYLKEDVDFPANRQLFDKLVTDGESLWVQTSGSGKNYTRTWEVLGVADGTSQRRVSIPHKGAVVAAALRDGALYTVEIPLGGPPRIAKYAPQ